MRGTLVFPEADHDFMQLLELRGNNGAQDDVETVFVLTGETYYVPTRLFAFDDPALYYTATAESVNANNKRMAEIVAEYYADRPEPKLIVRAHTHTNGNTSPSSQDKKVAADRKRAFDEQFDDYEFFLGIHALQDACEPDPEWLRRPTCSADNIIAWWGENRKHALAIYDEAYDPCPVVLR